MSHTYYSQWVHLTLHKLITSSDLEMKYMSMLCYWTAASSSLESYMLRWSYHPLWANCVSFQSSWILTMQATDHTHCTCRSWEHPRMVATVILAHYLTRLHARVFAQLSLGAVDGHVDSIPAGDWVAEKRACESDLKSGRGMQRALRWLWFRSRAAISY